jgi:hypothetical protein
MVPAHTSGEVDRWRARVHLRSPRSAVTTKRRALNFIQRVGFCLVFGSEGEDVPSLWRAVHGWRGDGVPRTQSEKDSSGFLWEMKQVLPSERSVYYAKLLLHRPTMVSLEMLPYFYALSGRTGERDEYIRASVRGGLSPMARRIMEAFGRSSHLSTRQIKQAVQRAGTVGSGSFGQAMTELQIKMFLAKGDEDRRPFSFTWSPVRILFAPQIRKARHISTQQARKVILEQHFRNQLVCTVPGIRRVFRWTRQEVYQPLGELLSRGIIGSEGSVEGTTGRVYIFYR